MSDIAKRLRASIKFDAVNGDSRERAICARQMQEAASYIDELEQRECPWVYDDDGYWQAGCGLAWCFDEGGPAENQAHYCPKCGGAIKQENNDDN